MQAFSVPSFDQERQQHSRGAHSQSSSIQQPQEQTDNSMSITSNQSAVKKKRPYKKRKADDVALKDDTSLPDDLPTTANGSFPNATVTTIPGNNKIVISLNNHGNHHNHHHHHTDEGNPTHHHHLQLDTINISTSTSNNTSGGGGPQEAKTLVPENSDTETEGSVGADENIAGLLSSEESDTAATNSWRSRVLVGDRVLTLPACAFTSPPFTSFLSYDVWTSLSKEDQESLMEFLPPNLPRDLLEQTLRDLLSGENIFFGNPLEQTRIELQAGHLHPAVMGFREPLMLLERQQHNHHVMVHHIAHVQALAAAKQARTMHMLNLFHQNKPLSSLPVSHGLRDVTVPLPIRSIDPRHEKLFQNLPSTKIKIKAPSSPKSRKSDPTSSKRKSSKKDPTPTIKVPKKSSKSSNVIAMARKKGLKWMFRCVCGCESTSSDPDDTLPDAPQVECTSCKAWCHLSCFGFTSENVPHDFRCHICSDPLGSSTTDTVQESCIIVAVNPTQQDPPQLSQDKSQPQSLPPISTTVPIPNAAATNITNTNTALTNTLPAETTTPTATSTTPTYTTSSTPTSPTPPPPSPSLTHTHSLTQASTNGDDDMNADYDDDAIDAADYDDDDVAYDNDDDDDAIRDASEMKNVADDDSNTSSLSYQ
eukprot:c15083_g1_i1.p1 GENE.c15083_g1_i1~~c15083_g1_i1.p1  ORF type:complete len:648 (+),score=174.15 c15083_g1_i1:156-2099(+)